MKTRVLDRCQKNRKTKDKNKTKKQNKEIDFSLYDARVLATLGKIIVVTFNYRIGVLGKKEPIASISEEEKLCYRQVG